MKKKLLAAAASVILVGAGGVWATSGAVEEPQTITPDLGGQWDFGASAGRAWSNFLNHQPHRTTVQGHTFADSGCVAADNWARAQSETKRLRFADNERNITICEQPTN